MRSSPAISALRDGFRAAARAAGLTPFVPDAIASPTVTALRVPDADAVLAALRAREVILADGQGPLKGHVLRIGHMGFVTEADLGLDPGRTRRRRPGPGTGGGGGLTVRDGGLEIIA